MTKVEELTNPALFADEDRLHKLFTALRKDTPVCRVEPEEYRPFWAVTRYETIKDIELDNEQFLSNPRSILRPTEVEQAALKAFGTVNALEMLVNMDGERHKKMRRIGQNWFSPKNISNLRGNVEQLAKTMVNQMASLGSECDFAADIAMYYPLRVLMATLGIPDEDEAFILKLTQQLFGGEDEDMARTDGEETGAATRNEVLRDFHTYFGKLIEEKRANPKDDLATVIATAEVDGEAISHLEAISYYVLTATAGHDTTSHTLAGGMRALIENPDQLRLLQDNPDLIPAAVDEMLRWVTPVKSFVRTAKDDCEVEGVKIKAGESLALYYPSANRDESIFDEPFTFDVTRKPNRHLAFGFGPHVCLGMHLAKMELVSFFQELLPRLDSIELAGEPQVAKAIFVTGLKKLPIKFTMS
ncbi:cytochrome P450 [Oceanicoccus sagamiensis]|nr:cytochrome P450 [Oceanicoccus sagamiensis]